MRDYVGSFFQEKDAKYRFSDGIIRGKCKKEPPKLFASARERRSSRIDSVSRLNTERNMDGAVISKFPKIFPTPRF